jgi:acetolactate synthase-1/2/3 large subunit
MGKGSVTGGSNLYMGTAALSSGDYVHQAVDHADLIIAIGHDTVEKPPFIMGPNGPKVIHVGFTAANVEQVYFPTPRSSAMSAPASHCWLTVSRAS